MDIRTCAAPKRVGTLKTALGLGALVAGQLAFAQDASAMPITRLTHTTRPAAEKTCPVSGAGAYTVTPITGIASQSPLAMNKWGQIAGTGSATNAPVLWTPKTANAATGKLLDLSRQPGYPTPLQANRGSAAAINDAGQVVGAANLTSGGDANGKRSWLWTPAQLNGAAGQLHASKGTVTPFDVSDGRYPTAINNLGVIAGTGNAGNPVLWVPAVQNGNSGTWTTDTNVSAMHFFINDAGQVGGGVTGNLPGYHGFDLGFLQTGFPPLAGSSIINSPLWSQDNSVDAIAINRSGDLIVQAVPAGGSAMHSYLFRNGAASDIGGGNLTLAYAMNDSDMVVGDRNGVEFLYSNGSYYALGALVPNMINGQYFTTFALEKSVAINAKGQILTPGSDGTNTLFLLTPAAIIPGKQPKVAAKGAKKAGTNLFTRVFTVTNTTGATLGPLSLVFDGLAPGVTIVGANGTTSFAAPAGSPYVNLAPSGLGAGLAVSVTVTFNAPSAALTAHTARVLAGGALR